MEEKNFQLEAEQHSTEFMESLGNFKEDYGQDLYDLVKEVYEYAFVFGAHVAIQNTIDKINAKINANKI